MSHIRLHITAEGPTERRFVERALVQHLGDFNVSTDCRCVRTSKHKNRGERGGLQTYEAARNDIVLWLKEDQRPECHFTTMFDLYALPKDFPGYEAVQKIQDPYERVRRLEDAFGDDVADTRFIPYIQLYEFESLIFVDPSKLADEYLDDERAVEELCTMLKEAPRSNPELINDGVHTAPSKRILSKIPDYDKANVGPKVAAEIGLDTLRQACKHFGEWLRTLENLSRE